MTQIYSLQAKQPQLQVNPFLPDFQAPLHRYPGSLIATGGFIAAEKSFCYIIDFKWNGSSWKYRKVEELPGEFSIQNKDGIQAPLNRY